MRTFAFLLGQQPDPSVGPDRVYRDLVDDAVAVEELGFDGVWVAEHHFSNYCVIPNPLTLVSALTQRTRRIRVGSAVVVLPLHNPVRVAEELAMCDQLSGGRLEAVLGRGFQPYEFDGLAVPIRESHARFAEGLDVVTHLLREGNVTYEGEYYAFPALTVMPRPVGAVPLWLACGSPQSVAAAVGRRMNVCLTAGVDGLGKLTGLRAAFDDACAAEGLATDSLRFAVQCSVAVVPDRAAAERAVARALTVHRLGNVLRNGREVVSGGFVADPGPSADEPPVDTVLSSTLIGNPDEVEAKVQQLREVGITDLFMNFRFGDVTTAEVRDSMRQMAELLELQPSAA